jgi:hypothetical protein
MTAKKLILTTALLLGTTAGMTTATLAQSYYGAPYDSGYRYGPSYRHAPYSNGNYYNYYNHPRGGPGGLGIGSQR